MGATVAWGLSFTLVKQGIGLVGLWPFFSVRFVFAALILLLAFRSSALKFSMERIKAALVLAFLLVIHLFFQTKGLETISASRSGFITSFYVPFTPLLSLFLFKRKVSGRQWALVFLACVGLTVLSVPNDARDFAGFLKDFRVGDIWTIAAAFVASFHIVATEKFARNESEPVSLGMWQFIFAGSFFSLGSFMQESREFLLPTNWPMQALICMALAALLATSFAFVMQIICQKRVESVKAAIIFALEAPFALLFGVALLGESLTKVEALGAFLLFTATVIPDRPKTT